MSKIEDIMDNLQGNNFFSVIDLKDAYYQVKIAERDKKKTTFKINGKTYEYERIPMGYKNASFIFQRIMNHELRKWLGKRVLVYLDDIVIYGKNEKEHDLIYAEIVEKLEGKNLIINTEKIRYKKR